MSAVKSNNQWKRGFWSVWTTQFQESFSDNAYRWLVVSFVIGLGLPAERQDFLTNAATVLFSLPFILFSPTGGYLADRYSKRAVILGTKFAELPVMGLAFVGLATRSLPVMFAALFLRGIQSACYSPSKFGMLPEVLPEKRLSWGNGLIELGSFLAIICGTVAGTSLYSVFSTRLQIPGAILLVTTLLGLAAAATLPHLLVPRTHRVFKLNPFAELLQHWREIRKDRVLFLAVLGHTYFYMLAALLQTTVLYLGKFVLHLPQTQIGYLQGVIAIGIGVGSLAAGYLSGGKIEYGLVPLGAAGLTVAAMVLSRGGYSFPQVGAILSLMGFAAGFFAVPVMAIIQQRPSPEAKGSVIGAANQLSFVGIALSGVLHYTLSSLGLAPTGIFFFAGLMTLGATTCAVLLMPDSLLRLALWLLVHTVYRLRVEGRDNIPERGGALFICKRLSLVDALLLASSTDRHVRCLIHQGFIERPLPGLIARVARAIPLSGGEHSKETSRSLRIANEAIRKQEVVCISNEEQLTQDAHRLPVHRELERLMKGVEAPIIPVRLIGLRGSVFASERSRYVWWLPKRAFSPLTVRYGAALPPTATSSAILQALEELHSHPPRHRS